MTIPNVLHAMNDGRFVDLKTGDVYRYEMPRVTSGKVATPTPTMPKLSPAAQRYVASAKQALSREDVEHFVALAISESGDVVGENQQSDGQWNHSSVQFRPILETAGRSRAKGMICLHNHINGDAAMSTEDRDLTTRLTTALPAYGCALQHEIVPGTFMVDEISKVNSVDIVTHPSAGGAFLHQLNEAEDGPWVADYPSTWELRQQEVERQPHWLREATRALSWR